MLKLQVLQMQVWYMHTTFAWLSSVIYQEKKKDIDMQLFIKTFSSKLWRWMEKACVLCWYSFYFSLFYVYICIYMYRKEMLQELNKEEGLNNEHGGVEGRSKSCGP